MTGDSEAHPDRPASERPVRVAQFDGLADASRAPAAVAGFGELDGLADASRATAAVAGLDAVDAAAAPAPVAALNAFTERAPARRDRHGAADVPSGIARGASAPPAVRRAARGAPPTVRRPVADGPVSDPVAPADLVAPADPGVPPDGDDGIPPDRPLPRGRRRVGRLGPDATAPDRPEPEADPVAVAREICLRLLTDRARTRSELSRALARKGVPDDAAAAVLDRFDEVGLIDDVAFAGQWVRSRHTYRGLGRRAIAVELRRKGVADDVAGEALAEVDGAAEARRARELVDRKLRSLTVDTAEQQATAGRRLVGMLARKGYGAGVAYRVVREALADHGAELDELAAEPADD